MMGFKARLFTPLPLVSLEELVPADHFNRHVDRVLDLSFVRDLVQDCYVAGLGRPSIDPVVFFKLQLVMFFEDVRSERLLMRLVADRLSVRWYLGYILDEPLPDHSSLTRIRLRYGLAVIHRFFEAIVEQCQQAGLVWGRELNFDATQVQANAARDSLTPRFAVEARTALHAHLADLFPEQKGQSAQEQQDAANSASVPSTRASETDPADGAAMPSLPRRLPVDLPESLPEEPVPLGIGEIVWIACDHVV
jgi:transposase